MAVQSAGTVCLASSAQAACIDLRVQLVVGGFRM
jgi:hypothetical protein